MHDKSFAPSEPRAEIDARYDHLRTEEKIYRQWEASGAFNPDNLHVAEKKKSLKPSTHYSLLPTSYSIMMPPPNANGSLHLGHAVGVTLQDIMIRYARMKGKKTLWLPGADHAGFETQVVFDKKLDKEGRNRFAMGRDELWKEIWEFTQTNKKVMEAQLRKLGASCDWSRETFTLDPKIIEVVYQTFERLFRDGLVYRDLRVVNWCPKHQTALSDLEVKYVEREDPLYFIKYGPLTLATVRPETKFGDTALAVNPHDKRYKDYVGKVIEAKGVLGPLKFKVIADDAVDPKFGTGVVKVTPAHDQTDFEIWTRHKKEIPGPKQIIDERGRLTGEVGEYKGLKVAEARVKIAHDMQRLGILGKTDTHYKHNVATCYKCGNTLEPLPKPQWFVKMEPLAKPAISAVKKGKVKFFPERTKKTYFHWLENIRDWNISRQIVWGIRIPAYFCLGCAEVKVNPEIKSRWYLLRHGGTDWNKEKKSMGHTDIPLNDEGVAQATRAAAQLKDKKIDLIISSDLSRARETAEIIAKATGAELVVDERIRERSCGITEGMLQEDIRMHYGSDRPDVLPGGETWHEFEARIWTVFQDHKRKHHHKNIVIVTHGGPIRMIRKNLKRLSLEDSFNLSSVKNAQVFELALLDSSCKKCGGDVYEQDPDVFDTWFSSGQWPFATLGYPKDKDFKTFYPTDVMETGYDILFFWVARMIMLGLYRTGEVPFKNVYLHGLVRDKDRQKMSKSKGNVIDPLGVAETYGTDAVRMALVVGNTAGNDIVISEDKIRGYRNFATKIWNIARFILMHREDPTVSLTAGDKKIVADAKKAKVKVGKLIESRDFHLAAELAYHYIWHTFADKVVEHAKSRLISQNLATRQAAYRMLQEAFIECLKMLHPFMPYISEELFQKFHPQNLLMKTPW